MELFNAVIIITRITSFLGILIVIYKDWGIIGLTINASIRMMACILMFVYVGKKLFPQLKISIFLFKKNAFKRIFEYGYKVQIILASALFMTNFMQIIISNLLGLVYVGYFTIGIKLATLTRMIPNFMFSALVPAISDINAKMKKNVIKRIYHKSSKYLLFFNSWFVFCLFSIVPYLIYMWLGIRVSEPAFVVYVIGATVIVNTLATGVGGGIMRGVGLVKYEMHGSIVRSLLILLMTLTFGKALDFRGLMAIIFVSYTVGTIYMCIKFNRYLETSPIYFFKKTGLFPLTVGLSLFILFHWVQSIYKFDSSDRIVNLVYAFLFSAAFSILYVVVAIFTRYFRYSEIRYIVNVYAKLLRKFNK